MLRREHPRHRAPANSGHAARVEIVCSVENRHAQLIGFVSVVVVTSQREFEAQSSPTGAGQQRDWIYDHTSP